MPLYSYTSRLVLSWLFIFTASLLLLVPFFLELIAFITMHWWGHFLENMRGMWTIFNIFFWFLYIFSVPFWNFHFSHKKSANTFYRTVFFITLNICLLYFLWLPYFLYLYLPVLWLTLSVYRNISDLRWLAGTLCVIYTQLFLPFVFSYPWREPEYEAGLTSWWLYFIFLCVIVLTSGTRTLNVTLTTISLYFWLFLLTDHIISGSIIYMFVPLILNSYLTIVFWGHFKHFEKYTNKT